ncbi:hypothetical protein A7C99_2116 [Trichophyton rubrum]|uniref:Superoxide dismutase [Cu-Zn] n=1 Tax=Trichophyton rubrum TaxID=5551 RepID=A0A178F406_TRIRU|nr:hypothetical protein A7C99_2116 [Trichophyton rubrum]
MVKAGELSSVASPASSSIPVAALVREFEQDWLPVPAELTPSCVVVICRAVAVVRGDSNVKGTVTFEQESENAPTTISWNITGHDPNAQRGFHIHQFGDNTNGCTSAGPHFNPFGKTHGAPTDEVRHVGDLGNITTDPQGNAVGSVQDQLVKLIGEHSVVGRTIVCHAGTDDLGKGGNEESLKTGNAGPRPACESGEHTSLSLKVNFNFNFNDNANSNAASSTSGVSVNRHVCQLALTMARRFPPDSISASRGLVDNYAFLSKRGDFVSRDEKDSQLNTIAEHSARMFCSHPNTLLWNGEVTGLSILASVTWIISHHKLTSNKGIEMAISSPMKEEQRPIESFTAYQI